MCERLDTLKHNMKIYNRDVSVKADKEGNMPPTIDDVIHSFENKDLISMEAACVIFENIYWISSQIKVPMYEYVEGDDIIAKAEVLGVIDPLDETCLLYTSSIKNLRGKCKVCFLVPKNNLAPSFSVRGFRAPFGRTVE